MMARLAKKPGVLSDGAARLLRRMLGHTLAAPPRAAVRWDSLSFVVALMIEQRRPPAVAEYEKARLERRAVAPSASALISRYGHWLRVAQVAAKLLQSHEIYLGPEQTPAKTRYRTIECAIALVKFHRTFGTWPTQEEYRVWAKASKQVASACGADDPRLTDSPTIIRHYATFDRALDHARTIAHSNRLRRPV